MKPIQLHPGSVLAGVGVALLAFVVMGQQVVSTGQAPLAGLDPELTRPPAFAVHPRDFVQIKEGTPYTVPAGKLFVLTALGNTVAEMHTELFVNGVAEAESSNAQSTGNAVSMKRVPRGFAVAAGSVITLTSLWSAPDDGRAWGYLADE